MVANSQKMPSDAAASMSSSQRFVAGVIRQCTADKGLAARLRRADNPATEYQCWDLLASYDVDLEYEQRRLPFATIAAAIAKSKTDANGSVRLGAAIAASFEEGNASDQAKARLRRLLACDDLQDVCKQLRPLFSLILSRQKAKPLDFQRILAQLRDFPFDRQRVRAQWADEFYRIKTEKGEEAES